MKFEHAAVNSNSVENSDKFFSQLLGMNKVRDFVVKKELINKFFGIDEDMRFLRFEKDDFSIEVIIRTDNSRAKDIYTHLCLVINDRENLIQKAKQLGFKTIKVPRTDKGDFYLFIKDDYGNIYEIKNA